MSLLTLLTSIALKPVPQHTTAKKMALMTRLISTMVSYIEEPEPPEEVEPAQAPLVHNLCFGGSLQLVVQVHSQVL